MGKVRFPGSRHCDVTLVAVALLFQAVVGFGVQGKLGYGMAGIGCRCLALPFRGWFWDLGSSWVYAGRHRFSKTWDAVAVALPFHVVVGFGI